MRGKDIAKLSDRALREELEARRNARRRSAKEGPAPQKVLQYFANLELELGATEADVRAAYDRLREKYDPDKRTDPGKRAVAERLTDALDKAYRGLLEHFAKRPRRR